MLTILALTFLVTAADRRPNRFWPRFGGGGGGGGLGAGAALAASAADVHGGGQLCLHGHSLLHPRGRADVHLGDPRPTREVHRRLGRSHSRWIGPREHRGKHDLRGDQWFRRRRCRGAGRDIDPEHAEGIRRRLRQRSLRGRFDHRTHHPAQHPHGHLCPGGRRGLDRRPVSGRGHSWHSHGTGHDGHRVRHRTAPRLSGPTPIALCA